MNKVGICVLLLSFAQGFAKQSVAHMNYFDETKTRPWGRGSTKTDYRRHYGNFGLDGWRMTRNSDYRPSMFEVYEVGEIDSAFSERDDKISNTNQRIDRRKSEINTLRSDTEKKVHENIDALRNQLRDEIKQVDQKLTDSIEEMVPTIISLAKETTEASLSKNEKFIDKLAQALAAKDEMLEDLKLDLIHALVKDKGFIKALIKEIKKEEN